MLPRIAAGQSSEPLARAVPLGTTSSLDSSDLPPLLAGGISIDSGQSKTQGSDRLVVLVPGLLAGPESLEAVRCELQTQGLLTGTFRYASEQGILSAANILSSELRRVHQSQPKTQVMLVTHSMGGIVARAVVENRERFSENVTKLVMIAPPNHGSALAELSTQTLQQTLLADQPVPFETMQAADQMIDLFFGQAKADMRPDSPLLHALNQGNRNPKIEYSIFCGSNGPLPGDLLSFSFLVSGFLLQDDPEQHASLQRIRKLAMLPEWIQGQGDGVVSIESARLAGVNHFETFAFGHNDFGNSCSDESRVAIQQIVQLLK